MKRNLTSEERISTTNLAMVTDITTDSAEAAVMLSFMAMLGELSDAIAKGDDVYMTFGANRARTALVFTLSDRGQKTYAAGQDILDAITHALETF